MKRLLEKHDLILMEGAVVERLRRGGRVELHPRLVHAALMYDEDGRRELQTVYQSYIDVARKAGLPILLCSPTWRANRERIDETGVSRSINRDAIKFMSALRDAQGSARPVIKIGGLIGCKHDCYRPEEGLSSAAAEDFHFWQVDRLSRAGADYLIAETLPAVREAVGIARAMAATGAPYIISFVIDRGGRVLDGTPLREAVGAVDSAVARQPLGFMVNCAHPTFLGADSQPPSLYARLIGYQGNASSRDHAELDGSAELDAGDIVTWGKQMLILNQQYGVKILGGCCGTGTAHLERLALR